MRISSPGDYMIQVTNDEQRWLELLESVTMLPIDMYIHSLISTDLRQAMAHQRKQFVLPSERFDEKMGVRF
jgi:hypothetical protein